MDICCYWIMDTLAYIIGNGDYRFTNIKFEEARAIVDMKESRCGAVYANRFGARVT